MLSRFTFLHIFAVCFFFVYPVFAENTQKTQMPSESGKTSKFDGLALQGKILETMNSSGYTYLFLDTTSEKIWVAIPESQVSTGQNIKIQPGMTMYDFTSKTLNRTFATIIFSPGLEQNLSSPQTTETNSSFDVALQAEQKQGVGIGEQVGGGEQSGGSAAAIVPSVAVKVDKASGPSSLSVGECFVQGKNWHGKTVRVRGKVVKISRMIMGKNWIHLQDGTGDESKKQHDLVITSMDEVENGAVITVEGLLQSERDFGAGYKYEVIVEDAKVER